MCLVGADRAWGQRRFTTIEIRKIIDNPQRPLDAGDKATLDEFFGKIVFERFKTPTTGDDLPKLRKGYLVVVRGAAKTPGHDYVTRLVFDEMFKIVSGRAQVAPKDQVAVRYNAMLLIADLNENDAAGSIKPMPEVFPLLMKVLNAPPELEYLKSAALIGLARFAEENGIPKERTAEVTEKLLALVNEKDSPPGRSASAHNYLRRGAAKVLAALGSPGPDNSVLLAFEAIAADPTARPLMRCEMARFIGELKVSPDSKVDLQRVANILGHQTVEVCNQELDRAELSKRPASRRLIMYALDSSSVALQKLSLAAERGTPAREFIYPLKNKLDSLYGTIGDPDETHDDNVDTVVAAQIVEIKGLLQDKQVPEAEPAPVVPAAPKPVPVRPASTK
jgi:hypothetical protein